MPPAVEELSDHELLARFEQGDSAAFTTLFERHERALYNFVLRSVRARDVAEDLAQEAWARVIDRVSDFERGAKFTTWLYTIARNLCIDRARRMRHRNHLSLDASRQGDGPTLLERVGDGAVPPDRSAASPDLRARIAAAVEALPEEQREVFLMRQLEGMAFADIAEVVGAPENTVKSRMRYALEHLQTELADTRDYAEASG
jgi:RNA polymerase sigma-70 factor (ECF subfamily)